MKSQIDSRIQNICLIIITTIALTSALIYTKSILIPFVFSIFFYALFSPIISYFKFKWKLPGILSFAITLLLIILFCTILIFSISASIDDFVQSAPIYRNKIIEFVKWISELLAERGFTLNAESILKPIKDLPIFSIVQGLTGGLVSFAGKTLLVFVFVIFLLSGQGNNNNKFIDEVFSKISRYIATKSITSLSTGLIVWVVLTIFDVELAFMFGLLAMLLNFIPTVGSLVATALPLPILVLQYGFSFQFVLVLVLTTATQLTIGNFIEPKMMGESMDLHPVTILIFLMFWGLVWGIAGMFLAVPITAVIKIILSRIETTRIISEILAGRLPQS